MVTAVIIGYTGGERSKQWSKVTAVVKGHSSGQSLQQWSKVTAVVKGYDNAVVIGYSCCYQRLQHSCCKRYVVIQQSIFAAYHDFYHAEGRYWLFSS